jgi:bifunctional DNase/RNase
MVRNKLSFAEMKVQKILLDEENSVSLVFLANIDDEDQIFPIVTGIGKANNILQIIKNIPFSRPLTYDLLDTIITKLEGTVSCVIIDKVKNDDVVATVHLKRQEKEISIESQACDAIAVALKAKIPIYTTKDLLVRYSEIMEGINEGNDQGFYDWLDKLNS